MCLNTQEKKTTWPSLLSAHQTGEVLPGKTTGMVPMWKIVKVRHGVVESWHSYDNFKWTPGLKKAQTKGELQGIYAYLLKPSLAAKFATEQNARLMRVWVDRKAIRALGRDNISTNTRVEVYTASCDEVLLTEADYKKVLKGSMPTGKAAKMSAAAYKALVANAGKKKAVRKKAAKKTIKKAKKTKTAKKARAKKIIKKAKKSAKKKTVKKAVKTRKKTRKTK